MWKRHAERSAPRNGLHSYVSISFRTVCFDLSRVIDQTRPKCNASIRLSFGLYRLIQVRVVGRFRLDDTNSWTQAKTPNLQTLDSEDSHQRILTCATDCPASSSPARHASIPTLDIKRRDRSTHNRTYCGHAFHQRHQICRRYYQQSLLRSP
jgi:hypothetical protein